MTKIKKWSNDQNIEMQLSHIKSDNYCYCKVGRAITIERAIEKSPILLAILENLTKKEAIEKSPKIDWY